MIEYKIKQHIATLSETDTISKELNLVSWNGNPAKYDIRVWKRTEEGRKASKGITLTGPELSALAAAIGGIKEGAEHEA